MRLVSGLSPESLYPPSGGPESSQRLLLAIREQSNTNQLNCSCFWCGDQQCVCPFPRAPHLTTLTFSKLGTLDFYVELRRLRFINKSNFLNSHHEFGLLYMPVEYSTGLPATANQHSSGLGYSYSLLAIAIAIANQPVASYLDTRSS